MTQAGNWQMNEYANLLPFIYLYAPFLSHWGCFLLAFGVTLDTRSVNLFGENECSIP